MSIFLPLAIPCLPLFLRWAVADSFLAQAEFAKLAELARIRPKLSADFESLPVLCKEFGRWRDPFGGEIEWLSLKRLKAGFHGLVGETRLEVGGEHEAEIVIEGDEPLVEGGIVEPVEGDAVADVEAFRFVDRSTVGCGRR